MRALTDNEFLALRLRRSDERIELGYRMLMDAVKALDAELAHRQELQAQLAAEVQS